MLEMIEEVCASWVPITDTDTDSGDTWVIHVCMDVIGKLCVKDDRRDVCFVCA